MIKLYRIISGLAILLMLSVISLAQNMERMQMGAGQFKSMAIGKIYGKVLNSSTKEPVEFATVTLTLIIKDSVINGALVKGNGNFSMNKIPFGKYRLKIQFIGFKSLMQNVTVTPQTIEQDLGDIQLELDPKMLKEVNIVGRNSVVAMYIDKRVYSPEKDLSVAGGTGIDVMKNIPGISVDVDGNVSLRNSAPVIFVDGRPTTLTLEQIPADQIEKVEIITNPSAKYDAATTGGILNIILKKNTKPGYNGMVGAGVGTGNRYNFNGNLNIKEEPFNLSLSYSLNSRGNKNDGLTNRTNLLNKETISYFNQTNISEMFNLMNFIRLGLDYNVTNRSTLSFSQNWMIGSFEITDEQNFTSSDAAKKTTSKGNRYTDQNSGWRSSTSQILLRYNFPKQGKELTSDFTYNLSSNFNESKFETYSYLNDGTALPGFPNYQKNSGKGTNDVATYQIDYVNPLSDSSKLELGFRSNYKLSNSLLNVFQRDVLTEYMLDSALSNKFDITDITNAAYLNYSSKIKSILFQLGLRVEQTYFIGKSPGKLESVEIMYPSGFDNLYKAFFPSIYFSRPFDNKDELQLNFSRKINRPGYMQVMPYIMFSDKQSYRIGNPTLAPEFINVVELNYNKLFTNASLFSSVFLKNYDGIITNYIYPLQTDSSILVSTYVNGDNSLAYGYEGTYKQSLMKKLDVTFNGNIFYSTINATYAGSLIKNSGSTWTAKTILSYKLPLQLMAQINGTYEAPRIIPQGKTYAVYYADISLAKEFGKKLSFNITLSDVFDTKKWGALYSDNTFIQEYYRRRDTRFLKFSFNYRFGEMDISLFKKKSQKRGDMPGGMEEF